MIRSQNNIPTTDGINSSPGIVMGATGARLWPNAVVGHASIMRPQGSVRRGLRKGAAPARAGPGDSLKAQVLSRKSITEWGRRWRSLETAATLPAPHLPGPHPSLSDPGLLAELPRTCQILAPLCGASADLSLLLSMGFKVIYIGTKTRLGHQETAEACSTALPCPVAAAGQHLRSSYDSPGAP